MYVSSDARAVSLNSDQCVTLNSKKIAAEYAERCQAFFGDTVNPIRLQVHKWACIEKEVSAVFKRRVATDTAIVQCRLHTGNLFCKVYPVGCQMHKRQLTN